MIPMYEKPSLVGDAHFKLHAPFQPAGDQPEAIDSLISGLKKGYDAQTLL